MNLKSASNKKTIGLGKNNTQEFCDKSQARQKHLFLEKNIIKAVLIISLPSMVIALMSSLYVFCDQILMAKLIPQFKPFENSLSIDVLNDFNNYADKLNAVGLSITKYSSELLVRNAVANCTPISIFITAATLLISNGTSATFSKYNGRFDTKNAAKTWSIGFYLNIIISMSFTLIMLIVCSPLLKFANGNPLAELQKAESTIKAECIKQGWDPAEVYSCLSTVYQKANDMIVQYSQQYSYIIISGQILLTFQSYLSLLIISEGKQTLVVLAAIIANLLNLLLDYIFINFFQMAMVGGAIATIIGWGFNCCWYFIQIYVYNKHNDTTLIYKALNLKQYAWDWKIVKNIIFIGLASFLRNLSMGIALWLQLFLLANFIIPKIGSSGATASSYTNFYGAVNPIYNLLFPVLLGTIQGSRIMCSYLYGAESWKRFRQTYWVAMSIGLVYGTFVVILFGLILNKYMLIAFNVNPNVQNFNDAKTMLIIALMQLPVYSFTIGGQIIFQATGRSLLASICALMQGLICNVPISFAMIGISIAVNSLTLFLWTPLIVVCFSSAIICTWTLIYMKKHFSPDLKLQVNK